MKIEIPREIRELIPRNERFCLAIDGRCGAGKTTLAALIAREYGCYTIHLDDFFLPRGMKKQGHGNLDKERLIAEVSLPLSQGKEVNYRRFSCSAQTFDETVRVPAGISVVIEGSYALLAELQIPYTHSVFLDVSPKEQQRRIRCRNGDEAWVVFANRWIPEEERYISACKVQESADLLLVLDELY